LAQIDAALVRLVDGRYGVCCACGRTIAIERLRLLPATPFCLHCARRRLRVSPIDAE
jgi:RNA polymerase-binding transcription factor